MKTPLELTKKLSTKLYNAFKEDSSNMLIVTSTFGWILSSAAQIGAVKINDKIPSDQKKFLIPQEIFDAVVNIGTFFLFTRGCDKGIKKLLSTGRLTSKPVRTFLEKNMPKEKIGKYATDITTILPNSPEIEKDYKSFRTGVTVGVNLIAGVIASNIITPILRNKIAAGRQKQSIADKMNQNTMLPAVPILPAQNRIGIDNYKKHASLNPYQTTGGSMRV